MSKVFISYVHEDDRIVRFLVSILKINDVSVWLDNTDLAPGQRWKQEIKSAISSGTYFLSIHSKSRQAKQRSYANDELTDAIDEVRRRPISRPWLIPVKIDDCEIEPRQIGGGETLLDLQVCDLTDWSKGIKSLLRALGVENPIVDLGKPLSNGLPSFLKVTSGIIYYSSISGAAEMWQGMEHRIIGGWCQRDSNNKILAYFEIKAPLAMIENFNRQLGYTGFHANCEDEYLSQDSTTTSMFTFARVFLAPAGTIVPDTTNGTMITLPRDVSFLSTFAASGYIDGYIFKGTFTAETALNIQFSTQRQVSTGNFEIIFAPDF